MIEVRPNVTFLLMWCHCWTFVRSRWLKWGATYFFSVTLHCWYWHQHYVCQWDCLSIAPLHSLVKYDLNNVQHNMFCYVMPLVLVSVSHYAKCHPWHHCTPYIKMIKMTHKLTSWLIWPMPKSGNATGLYHHYCCHHHNHWHCCWHQHFTALLVTWLMPISSYVAYTLAHSPFMHIK